MVSQWHAVHALSRPIGLLLIAIPLGAQTNNPPPPAVNERRLTGVTLVGGTAFDSATDIELAADGSPYLLISSGSTDFPGLTGASPSRDVVVAKLDPARANLIWAVRFGGSADDDATAMAVDPSGNLVIVGSTVSNDFPQVGAFLEPKSSPVENTCASAQPISSTRPCSEAFVVRLSGHDGRILNARYFGGRKDDVAVDVVVSGDGSVYVVGHTNSADFPRLGSVAVPECNGGLQFCAGFYARFASDAVTLMASGVFGGSSPERVRAGALVRHGELWVVGETESDDFIGVRTPGRPFTFQPFLVRVDPNTATTSNGRLLGGAIASDVEVDSAGDVYVIELLRLSSPTAMLVTKLRGGSTLYSARLNGAQPYAARVDASGRLFVAGTSHEPGAAGSDPLTTVNPFQATRASQLDGFVAALSASGDIVLASYLPAGAGDLALDATGNLLVTGAAPHGAFARVTARIGPGGDHDAFIARIAADRDGDGMSDEWEQQFGLSPTAADANADPDADGRSNLAEFNAGTHPTATFTSYFAEGARSSFFSTSIALLNPDAARAARVLLRFQGTDGTRTDRFVNIPAHTRATVDLTGTAAGFPGEFSTVVESDVTVVADRTMSWDARGYGSHAETSLPRPSTTWYLAEGATHSGFNLFYLLQNPNDAPATVTVTYLLSGGAAPIVREYVVAANSRKNIWVNQEGPGLAAAEMSARITADRPILVERAMYLDTGGLLFGAGHESAGVTTPSLTWYFAEGATGAYFDEFVLIANPEATAANVTADYLLPAGTTVTKTYAVAPLSRYTIWVDQEHSQLANTAVSVRLTSTNGVPVVAERAMWWPGSNWHEAHAAAGATATGTRWALAEGQLGGSRNAQTYILIANTSARSGAAAVTLYFEDGTSLVRTFTLAANSRFNVDVSAEFPAAAGRRFGAVVQSTGATPAEVVVERAMYFDAGGVVWAAGTSALATRLP